MNRNHLALESSYLKTAVMLALTHAAITGLRLSLLLQRRRKRSTYNKIQTEPTMDYPSGLRDLPRKAPSNGAPHPDTMAPQSRIPEGISQASVKLLYIGGYGHSGSTLLEGLLSTCPQVLACGEIASAARNGMKKAHALVERVPGIA